MTTPLLLAQQIFSSLSLNTGKVTSTNDSANSTATAVPQIPSDLPSLLTFLISLSAMRDWLKLIVIGGFFETCRRFIFSLYYKIYNSFFITAHFQEDDSSYDWMMVWLSKQPSWAEARDVQISTRSFGLNGSAVVVPGEEEDPNSAMNGVGSRKIAYLPSVSSTYSLWYKHRWMRVTRTITQNTGYYGRSEEGLHICILSWDHNILNKLLLEAKKEYMAAQENTISIYVSDTSNNWRHVATRPKRSLRSIVLDPGVKDILMDDARDFLESKRWYAARGIPFRRGYLLYGAPGSGKTSIIHSMAGELGLDVYVISLSRAGLDDTSLSEIIADLPERCIALMEDIDAAFTRTLNRDDDENISAENAANKNQATPPPPTSRISLSGLLNALDGVGAQEGRILFATTNKYTSLDPALCRPGRMDIHIEFRLASKYQIAELYRCFYLPDEENEETQEKESVDSGYGSDEDLIDLDTLSDISESAVSVVVGGATFIGSSHRGRAPKLSRKQVNGLAIKFRDAMPEREFSMASLQGYLMMYKTRPFEAVREVESWVGRERAEREAKAKAAEKAKAKTLAPVGTAATGESAKKEAAPEISKDTKRDISISTTD
ncbi:P-loop containing nucleoside triphosphate hydrolase protein [Cyathus striatus]|nr:P-loop containing nucleoside triphosphate hydrolase protein [Cyathus striatus]